MNVTPRLEFECSDASVVTDTIALACGTLASEEVWTIDVVVGVPTTSTDIMGFNFDVLFDPAYLSYVSGSAVSGTLLGGDGATALVAANVPGADPGRLVVGIHRTGTTTGAQGLAGQGLILRFALRTNSLVGFGPTQLVFENAEAVDSQGSVISTMTFNDQLLLSVQ